MPADFGLATTGKFGRETVRCQGLNHVFLVVHGADVAQQGFIDAACQVETEVRILTHAHVGKVLVRHGFENGAGHHGATGFAVVAIVEFACGPVAVFLFDICGD